MRCSTTESFKTKEKARSRCHYIFQLQLYPELYGNLCHVVRINYYPPRGDNKEGWDNIDLVGWLGYPMQLKINFLCRDSILAAPIVLDVALFLDLAKRAGMHGIQEWLSFYFKSPVHAPGLYPEHDLFIQLMKLKNTLRYLKGEELITHLGRDIMTSQVRVRHCCRMKDVSVEVTSGVLADRDRYNQHVDQATVCFLNGGAIMSPRRMFLSVLGRGRRPGAWSQTATPVLRQTRGSGAWRQAGGQRACWEPCPVMRSILFHNSNLIFSTQSDDPADPKKPLDASFGTYAKTYTGWPVVESVALAESADSSSSLDASANGCPVPVDRADFRKFAQGLRAAGQAALKAAQSKNMDNMVEVSGTVSEACENCHSVYRDKPDLKNRCIP